MEIRRASLADAPVMRSLWEEFNTEATYTPYPPAPFDDSFLDHIALIAEESGTAVGIVYANLAGDHFGFVFGLYVRPLMRRRGMAGALMRAIAEAIRNEGRRYVVLNVDTPNAAARAFYARLGFVDAARTLRADVGTLLDRVARPD